MSLRPHIAACLAAGALFGGACTGGAPVGRPSELAAVPANIPLPERIATGAVQDSDRSGDLRPEAAAIIDFAESRSGVITVDDLRTRGLLPPRSPALATPVEPATIRVWRRAVDGSQSSCSGRVDVISFEQYVKGVLPHEWIASWKPRALEAGAVAARSYAAFWVASGGKYQCADVDDTTASQVYKDSTAASTDAAVDATAGVLVVKDGSIVFAQYSAENGDPTADGVDDPYCAGQPRQGHGHGMCQWGTQRWAVNTQHGYAWMVSHYYPGATTLDTGGGVPADGGAGVPVDGGAGMPVDGGAGMPVDGGVATPADGVGTPGSGGGGAPGSGGALAPGASVVGGCRVAPGAGTTGASALGCAILLACALLCSRRRRWRRHR